MIGIAIAATAAGACLAAWLLHRRTTRRRRVDLHAREHDDYLERVRNTGVPGDRPNIIIVFCDDMGLADISCFGATTIATPNIDALAREGIKLVSFYSSSPVCSPSRAGLLTGRYPTRMHVNHVFFPKKSTVGRLMSASGLYTHGVKGLLQDEIALGEVMQAAGYATGLVGKWHLGDVSPHLPNERGFDFFYGSYYSNDMKPYAMMRDGEVDIPAPVNQDELTGTLTREAVAFITRNKDRPFFLHYCQPFPHHPLHASDRFKNTSKAGIYGDAVQEVDWSIGELINTLEKLGLRERTMIFFTSDNGPWHEGNPGYQRGRKGQVFEGGQRVPAIVSWPGTLPGGRELDAMTMNIDVLPTVADLLGLPLPGDRIIDGKSLLPRLRGETSTSPHDVLHYFWGKRLLASRDARWKYHVRHGSDNASYYFMKTGPFLFDLSSDPNESYNQLAHHPAPARDLEAKLVAASKALKDNPRGWIRSNLNDP